MFQNIFSEIPCIEAGDIALRKVTLADKESLKKMTVTAEVYKYLPAFLYEKKYEDTEFVINHMYDEVVNDSLILGIYRDGEFCGLTEIYGFRDEALKLSVGCRLMKEYQGEGIVTEVLKLLTEYLYNETETEMMTASALPENKASERVLEKAGFTLAERNVPEDWGYENPLPTDKWVKKIR